MEQQNHFDEQEFSIKELYSKLAIRGFSFFFSPIFGGAMLMLNLRKIGKPKEGWMVLAGALLYTTACVLIFSNIEVNSSTSLFVNFLGAFLLADGVQRWLIPNADSYPKRKIWIPLAIGILLYLPLILLILLLA